MFQRLLVCTDLVDGLQRLVDFVPSLAASGAQHIVFLSIIQLSSDQAVPHVNEDEIEAVRQRLSRATHQTPAGVEVHIEIQVGQPTDRILCTAESYKSDLILLGAQSRSLLTEKLFGSTTIALCQRTKIPLLILRPQLLSSYMVGELDWRCRHLFHYFLMPYNGTKPADHVVNQIKTRSAKESPHCLQECLLYWVVETGGRRSVSQLLQKEETKQAESRLNAVKHDLEALDLKVNTAIVVGEPLPEVLMAAQENDISAIAIASDRLGKIVELSVPSFAGELIRRSWHPILYFPL